MTDSTDGTILQTSENQLRETNSTMDGVEIGRIQYIQPKRKTKPYHPKSYYTKKRTKGRKK